MKEMGMKKNKPSAKVKEERRPSHEAIERYPDPDRKIYFNDADYLAAIVRVREKRANFDKNRV
jgi:hypothetical protein